MRQITIRVWWRYWRKGCHAWFMHRPDLRYVDDDQYAALRWSGLHLGRFLVAVGYGGERSRGS